MKVGVNTCKKTIIYSAEVISAVVQAFKAVVLNEIFWRIKQMTECQVTGATLR